ncbi:hypothetical protein RCDURKIN_32 [Rhodobacter phage RcDurkin]|nr:hypothetical protein RCDURKIN_32 [Rhodobacter phage RcDurkin]
MRPKIRNITRRASELHGADASFVSVVDRGANEQPFKSVKNSTGKGTAVMAFKKRSDTAKQPTKKGTKPLTKKPEVKDDEAAPVQAAVAKMTFDADMFETEQDVRDYIEKAEWEVSGVTITKNDDDGVWEAREDGTTDDDFDQVNVVPVEEDGVEVFIGKRSEKKNDDPEGDDEDDADDGDGEDDADDEDDADADKTAKSDDDKKDDEDGEGKKKPASKRAEFLNARKAAKASVQKFDAWDATYSTSNTVVEALKAGMTYDKTPPGYYEVNAAFNGVMRTLLGSESATKAADIAKAAADFAEVVTGLDAFFDKIVSAEPDAVTKAVGDDTAKLLTKWAEDFADALTADEAPAPAKKEAAKKGAEPGPAPINVAELIAKAVQPVLDQVGVVADKVEKMAARAPTKKAQAIDDAEAGTKKPAAKTTTDDKSWLGQKSADAIL